MKATTSNTVRLSLLAGLLLLLAACSAPAGPPATVSQARAVAGPDYAQLYWSYPAGPADFEIEQRTRTAVDDWSDWLPSAAIIDTEARSALLEIQAGSQYQFRIGVWLNDQLQWQEAQGTVSAGDGVTLQVGTMNRWQGDTTPGTAFLVYLDLPEDVTVPLQLSFTGPEGWAAGAHPLDASVEHLEAGYIIDYLYGLPALQGTYSVVVTDDAGLEFSSSIEFSDDDFRLDFATGHRLSGFDAASGSLTASWTPPVGGARNQVVLLDEGFVPVSEYVSTDAASFTFTGMTGLTASTPLQLEVTASNLVIGDGPQVMPVPFGISVASAAVVTTGSN